MDRRELNQLFSEFTGRDPRGAVWCAALYVREGYHAVSMSQSAVALAVDLTVQWSRGEDPDRDLMLTAVADANRIAADDSIPLEDVLIAGAAAQLVSSVVYTGGLLELAGAASSVAGALATRSGFASHEGWTYTRAHASCLLGLARIVQEQTNPVVPTGDHVRRARERAAVVWDNVAAEAPVVQIGGLGAALDRARVGGWRWHDPIERAIAERVPETHPVLEQLRRSEIQAPPSFSGHGNGGTP